LVAAASSVLTASTPTTVAARDSGDGIGKRRRPAPRPSGNGNLPLTSLLCCSFPVGAAAVQLIDFGH
jgi:hypothetical protein